jgi:hypothetical protein
MGEPHFSGRRGHGLPPDFSRYAITTRIYKNHSIGVGELFRYLRQELLELQDFHLRRRQCPLQSLSNNPTDAVVAA